MPWVKFTANFNWTPIPPVTIAYKAGMRLLVTTACANAAIMKGVAEPTEKPEEKRNVVR